MRQNIDIGEGRRGEREERRGRGRGLRGKAERHE